MLTEKEIRDNCSFSSIYQNGQRIQRLDRVSGLYQQRPQKNLLVLWATVSEYDTREYETQIVLDTSKKNDYSIVDYTCECPISDAYSGMCWHCVALALEYRQMELEGQNARDSVGPGKKAPARKRTTSARLSAALVRYGAPTTNQLSGIRPGTVHLVPELTSGSERHSWVWMLSARIGVDHLYVVKDLFELIRNVERGAEHNYGKKFGFVHSLEMFDPASQKVYAIIEEAVRNTTLYGGQRYYSTGSASNRYVYCNGDGLARIFRLFQKQGVILDGVSYPVREGVPPIVIQLDPDGSEEQSGAFLTVPTLMEITSANNGYYLYNYEVYHCPPNFRQEVIPFMNLVEAMRDSPRDKDSVRMYLSSDDYRSFCGNVLPRLAPFLTVETGELDLTEFQPQTPEFKFYLSQGDAGSLLLRPSVCYGSAEYPLFANDGSSYRRPELETPVCDFVNTYFVPKPNSAYYGTESEDKVYSFLEKGMEQMRSIGQVYLDDSLHSMRIKKASTAHVGVRLFGDMLDLTVQLDDLPEGELDRILTSYAHKKRYHRLKSGEFLSLEEGSLAVLSELADALDLQGQSLSHLQVPAFRAQYVNDLLTSPEADVEVRRSTDFKRLIRNLRDYSDSDYDIPEDLSATLRGYQKIGYRWLCTLADCGLGGILADDMGLGKTVQAIAFLLHLKKNALVICPASLVYNWQAEFHKFAPGLKIQLVKGTAALREDKLAQEADVYITSYDLLLRDVKMYEDRTFGCCILDEAQYIRNSKTKSARAVKRVHAEHRFALTGTPISNHLSDLWSIFDFLIPGYLYPYNRFREQLERPIAEGDQASLARLQRMTAPFLLCRKKEDVLRELPEKIVSIQYVEMSEEQRLLYRAQEQQLRSQLQSTDEEKFKKEQIQILSALTRLRQLCCTPELYLENYHGGSGKVDACMEQLTEMAQSGHKTLVFSQFTTMLEELVSKAEEIGLRGLYLSGKNTMEQRRDMVAAFQSGEYDVFFISLKAGGTGLNLTAADRVIHFDPWWNAAAEDQATDRTHRIGQDKTVFVTKMVTKDTIEERIVELQEKKRQLSEEIVTGADASSDGRVSREELLSLLTDAAETEQLA